MRAIVLAVGVLFGGCSVMDAVSGVDREAAFMEGQRMRAEHELAVYSAQKAQKELQTIERLAEAWRQLGFSGAEAQLIASAYEDSATETLVISSVRRKGLGSIAADVRGALDSHNYLLANQLIIAASIVRSEIGE